MKSVCLYSCLLVCLSVCWFAYFAFRGRILKLKVLSIYFYEINLRTHRMPSQKSEVLLINNKSQNDNDIESNCYSSPGANPITKFYTSGQSKLFVQNCKNVLNTDKTILFAEGVNLTNFNYQLLMKF